jgi:hypothetical protein
MPIARTILAGVFAGLLIGGAFGQSPEPTETNQPNQVEQVPNAQRPVVVNVQPAAKTDAEAAEERHEREEKAKLDRRLVDLTAELSNYIGDLFRATVLLAIGTFFLVVATLGLIAAAIRQEWWTRKHERAYVIAGLGSRQREKIQGKAEKDCPAIGLGITAGNYGRTPAFLKQISVGLCPFTDGPLPPYPPFQTCEDVLYPNYNRKEVDTIFSIPILGNHDQICYGRIVYNDIFGREHWSSWKHKILANHHRSCIALPGSYSAGWDYNRKQQKTDPP